MNDFTKKYAELISRYVDIDDMEHFHEDFEELLDAYENGDDDEPAKVIHGDATPDEIADVVKSAFDKKLDEHERRHQSQAVPLQWSIEKQRAYNDLIKLEDFEKIKQAAKAFVDICNREKQARDESSEKERAYGKLLDCVQGCMAPEKICDAAIALAQACKAESEKPEVGEVYRDIFGNKYIIVAIHDSSPDGKPVKKPLVMLIYSNAKGELSSSTFFAVPLEDFMNPTFKKE